MKKGRSEASITVQEEEEGNARCWSENILIVEDDISKLVMVFLSLNHAFALRSIQVQPR
jgi:hypothetical protein